jgi:hypothetical protein
MVTRPAIIDLGAEALPLRTRGGEELLDRRRRISSEERQR